MCSSDNVLQVVTLFKTIGLPSKPYTYSHGHITVEYHRPVSVSVNVLTTHVISYLTTLPYALVADLHSTRMVSNHKAMNALILYYFTEWLKPDKAIVRMQAFCGVLPFAHRYTGSLTRFSQTAVSTHILRPSHSLSLRTYGKDTVSSSPGPPLGVPPPLSLNGRHMTR